MSFHWSPMARTAPSGTRSRRASHRIARPFETPGAVNSTNRGWLTMTSARPAKRSRASGADLGRQRRLARRQDLGDRAADRLHEVLGELGRGAHEHAVIVGSRVVCPDDEPFEAVQVRIEAVRPRPLDDRARDLRAHRRVDEQTAEPIRARDRHVADECALVADDRGIEVQLAGEAHRARHHPPRDKADHHAPRRAARIAARVSGPIFRSSPTSVPSMSRATRPTGTMGSGVRILGTR